MPRFLKIALAFLAGFIVGEALPIIAYILATNYLGLFDRDGGGAMAAIFIMGPMIGFTLATVFASVAIARTRPS